MPVGANSVILDINPSWTLRGSRASARLLPDDYSSWPKSLASHRWRLRHNEEWLGEDCNFNAPIEFQVTDQAGQMLVEACHFLSGRVQDILARNHVHVFGSHEEMLDSAISDSDLARALEVFDKLMAQWTDRSVCRHELSTLLKPYFRDGRSSDRAVIFSLRLTRSVFNSMASAWVRDDSNDSSDLMGLFETTVWERRSEFDPDRGRFEAWAYFKLYECRKMFLRELGKAKAHYEVDECRDATIDDGGIVYVDGKDFYEDLVKKLVFRFSRDKVDMYIIFKTETPSPTYLEIADRLGWMLGSGRKAREAAVGRAIHRIESYVKFVTKDLV
jgi:hypothetical protein